MPPKDPTLPPVSGPFREAPQLGSFYRSGEEGNRISGAYIGLWGREVTEMLYPLELAQASAVRQIGGSR